MAFIDWDDSLSVNIDSIDRQHKKIITLINDFYENIRDRSNQESIIKLVQGMKEYAAHHFSYEERYMKEFDFAGYQEHKEEHDKFVQKIEQLQEKLQAGKAVLSFEITSFLKKWIFDHIQGTDKKYSELLIRNGIR